MGGAEEEPTPGRVVLVTGGGSGLGRECALEFARYERADIVLTDVDAQRAEEVAQEVRSHGVQALVVIGDVRQEAHADEVVEQIRAWRGRVDVLVNNAGVSDSFIPSEDQAIDDWQRVLDISLRGMFLFSTKIAKAFMLPQRFGRVISMGSLAGIGGLRRRNAYSAAKAGIIMTTRTLATEWAARGVTVNAVSPGYIQTPMSQDLADRGLMDVDLICRRTPAGHMGVPHDIARAVRFLAEPGSSFITGVNLPVDGGWSVWATAGDAWSPEEED